MTKSYLAVAALLTASAFPVLAGTDMKDVKDMKMSKAVESGDAGFYVAAYGGAQFDTDYGDKKQTVTTAGGSNFVSHDAIHSSYGGAGGLKAGYNFESFALCDTMKLRLQPAVEVEALYLGTSSKSGFGGFDPAAAPGGGGGGGVVNNAVLAQGNPPDPKDSFNSGAGFINGILRFKNCTIVTPYIGLGAGGEYITIHGDATTTDPANPHITGLNGSDLDFAGQGLAGFDVAIAHHFSIFTEYKFIDAIGTDAKTSSVGSTNTTYRFKPDQIQQHLIVAGLKYTF